MKLTLVNIGILSRAEVIIDGLTLIAGENDSGKSTVGKVLYALIKTIRWASNVTDTTRSQEAIYIDRFNDYIKKLFNNQISTQGTIDFDYQGYAFHIEITQHRCITFTFPEDFRNEEPKITSPLFIDSPYIWHVFPSLKTINTIENRKLLGSELDFGVPETLQDLYAAIELKSKNASVQLKDIQRTIGGEFVENHHNQYVFKKGNEEINLINTAMGIKYLGTLQVLAKNNHLYAGQILILDEPEVHLHPNWQIKLAQWIVELSQAGIKLLVNSHSPYMIEALQRYADQQQFRSKTHFYLADQGNILPNDQALSQIFAKLSMPFAEFDRMDSEALHG